MGYVRTSGSTTPSRLGDQFAYEYLHTAGSDWKHRLKGLFNIPLFWPILLLYFIVLFMLTMKRQIKHMWKHKYAPSLDQTFFDLRLHAQQTHLNLMKCRYVPWSSGKKTYKGRREPVKTAADAAKGNKLNEASCGAFSQCTPAIEYLQERLRISRCHRMH